MNKELLKGTLNIILLLVLSKRTTYGYELASTIDKLSNSTITLKESSLYTALLRLEQQGYIKSSWSETLSYPRRKYYEITPLGSEYLTTNLSDYLNINSLINNLINLEEDQ
ncbi:PadR family transcriptional regulator [Inconstantimicrobium mannanitabidum]|uniref:PadR family transcriptional regulator n=1 Tax=Inconstantimicrobium mannanitabidum TaxID=1604901 RepID=A0ACB5RGK7_9CLOT|nr:PadR family transcriptional regulator [Clostridium sp. TW13]GKX68168.1 PadR family transcriptional regulator [Clostridium sp. TW13]